MALPSILKSRRNVWTSIKPVSPSLIFFTNNITASSNTLRSICNHTESFCPSDITHVVNGLISIFTKQPFSPDNPELKNLASRLSTKAVESVLNGLKSWKIAHMFFTWAPNQCGYKHNCYTYSAMASHLSRARQNVPLRAMTMEVVNSNCSLTPGALGFFLRCLGSVELVQEANFLFDQVTVKGLCVPNSYSYNCLLEAISKSNSGRSIELLEMRLQEMRESGWEFSKYTLTPALQVYCKAGKFEKALNVFNEMHDRGWVDAHVMSILVLSFSKWGELDKAFDLIERMEDHNLGLNEKTFHVLIHGFVRQSRMDKALQLFDKMRKSGFPLDISLFDVLIGGLCKNKELEKALTMYSEMKELGIHSDVGILTKLIPSFSDEAAMIRLLEEVQEDLNQENMHLIYTCVLNGLINKGSSDTAYQLLQVMMENEFDADADGEAQKRLLVVKKKVHPVTTHFEIVIDGLLKFDKLDTALSLFKDMIQIGCIPNVSIYNNLIHALCNSNRLEESYKFLRDMKQYSGLEPTHFTYNSIFGCLCRRQDVLAALNLVKEMRACGHEPWIKHSTLLVKQLCQHGKVVEACSFLDGMVQQGFLPNIVAYSTAINGLIKIQQVEQALQMFQEICARGYSPDVVSHNILINGLCKAQRVSEAEHLLNEMVTKGLVPSVVSYNLLIDGWCKNSDVDKAMLCLTRMFGEDREPNVITYTALVDGLCNVGRVDDALLLWNDMGKKGCAPNRIAYMALITGLCKCGRPDEALLFLRQMEEKNMKPEIFVYAAVISASLSHLNLPRHI